MTVALGVVTACTLALAAVLVVDGLRSRRPLRDVPPPPVPGGRTALVFLTSTCTTCRAIWEALDGAIGARLPSGTRVVVVTEDAATERTDVVRALAPPGTTVVMSSATWRRFGVTAAPHVVIVDEASGRRVAAAPVGGVADVLRVLGAPAAG